IQVSAVRAIGDAHVSYAFDNPARYAGDPIGQGLFDISSRAWRTRGVGDFWQHMLVAEGAFDVSVDPIVNLWDVAALVPIVEEAGGGGAALPGTGDADGGSLVCTNGLLHDEVLALLHRAGAGAGSAAAGK